MRLVMIDWDDAASPHLMEWRELSDCKPTPGLCRSVGWLLHDDKDYKVVVPHLLDEEGDPQCCGDMTIPTHAIISIKDLQDVGPIDKATQDVV